MYYTRTLSDFEALFVSRSQQRIAELGALLADEFSRNDVDNYKAQLIVELEYAIKVLYSTDLSWTPDDIRMMIDYYTELAELTVFGFRSMIFAPTQIAQSCDCDAILTMIQNLTTTVNDNFTFFYNWINQIDQNWQAGDTAIWNYLNTFTGGAPVLAADLESDQDVGGIQDGDTWAEGDLLEDVLRDLLKAIPVLSNFTFNTWADLVEIGSTIPVATFTWDTLDDPQNMKISDNQGVMTNVPVTGVSFTPGVPYSYDFTIGKTIIWTLTADRAEPVTIDMTSVYMSYFDKETTANDDPVTITEAKILASTIEVLARTATEITIPVNTSNVEQGFIAVAKTQSEPAYDKWRVNDNNNATIATGEFIRPPIDITVGGVVYSVYRWGYRSPLVDNLKLQR